MKIRAGFVSNSSSTSFYIKNTSNKKLSLVDFATETSYLVMDFVNKFYWHKGDSRYSELNLVASAYNKNEYFKPGEEKVLIFGDEDGTIIGEIFDYMLRDGGKSDNFKWRLKEYLR